MEVIEFDLRRPPPGIRAALELDDPQALYVLRVRNNKRGGDPLLLTETWLPAAFSGAVNRRTLTRRAMYEVLASAGVDMGRIAQALTAEIADPRTAQLLHTDIGAALLRINRLVYAIDDRPIEHLSIYLSPARSRIRMDIEPQDIDTAASGFIAHDVGPMSYP